MTLKDLDPLLAKEVDTFAGPAAGTAYHPAHPVFVATPSCRPEPRDCAQRDGSVRRFPPGLSGLAPV